ncbi:MAG: hypothetical protein HKN81_05060, partial [Gammaproteobacteria bacterium]|nr:hypothetical protein [Gammaproteobacteria bacterium]
MRGGDKLNKRPTKARASLCALFALIILPTWAAPTLANAAHYEGRTEYRAPRAEAPPAIDGIADERVWQRAPWQDLAHRWLGPEYSPDDFQGRYKVVWTERRVFILAEFTDDVLIDQYRDPLQQYWDDDCLEIFIDEDFSGGNHQFNHNAFAYHMSLDNRAIDIGTDERPHDYS